MAAPREWRQRCRTSPTPANVLQFDEGSGAHHVQPLVKATVARSAIARQQRVAVNQKRETTRPNRLRRNANANQCRRRITESAACGKAEEPAAPRRSPPRVPCVLSRLNRCQLVEVGYKKNGRPRRKHGQESRKGAGIRATPHAYRRRSSRSAPFGIGEGGQTRRAGRAGRRESMSAA